MKASDWLLMLRTVAPGDVLSVEYEGQLENGTVFDSSKSRGAPFGPFVHGRRQIIEGYTQALEVRSCANIGVVTFLHRYMSFRVNVLERSGG